MEIVDHSQTRQQPGQKRRGSGCPGLEKALGAVEMVLVPSDRKDFDSPASVAELVSKLPVSLGTDHPREVIEAALAHVVGNGVEAAYARSDLFERRRILMNDWACYLAQGRGADPEPLE